MFTAFVVALSIWTNAPGGFFDYKLTLTTSEPLSTNGEITFPFQDSWDVSVPPRISLYNPVDTSTTFIDSFSIKHSADCVVSAGTVSCPAVGDLGYGEFAFPTATFNIRVQLSSQIKTVMTFAPTFTAKATFGSTKTSIDAIAAEFTVNPAAGIPALQYVNIKFPNVVFDPKDRTLVNNFIKQFTAELAFASKVDASRFYIYKLDNIAGLIVDMIVAPPSKEAAAAFKAGTGKNPRSASDIFIDIREQAKWGTSVLRYPRAPTPVANVWGGQMTATDAVLQKCAFVHNPPYMPDCDNLPCTEDCSDGFSDLVMIIGIVGASLCVIGLLIAAKKMKSHDFNPSSDDKNGNYAKAATKA